MVKKIFAMVIISVLFSPGVSLCLRPVATATKLTLPAKAEARRAILRTLIPENPPKSLKTRKQKFMYRIAYKAAHYFDRKEIAETVDEIFGLCFQAVMQEDAERSQDPDKKPLEELDDAEAIKCVVRNVFDLLTVTKEISGISAESRDRIIAAIGKNGVSGKKEAVFAIAKESGVDRRLVERYLSAAFVLEAYGTAPDEMEDKEDIFDVLAAEQARVSDFTRRIAGADFTPEKIDSESLIRVFLSQLNEQLREAVYLLYLEDRSKQEVAFILNFASSWITHLDTQVKKILSRIALAAKTPSSTGEPLTIEEVKEQVYKKYKDRLEIAGRYEDNIEAKSADMEPSTPEEDIELLKKAISLFPEEAKTEAEIAKMLYLERKDGPEIKKALGLSRNAYQQKKFSAHIYLNHYLQGEGAIGFIVRKIRFSEGQTMDFSEAVGLCYKHNLPIVDKISCRVYDRLRRKTIDLARLNNFGYFRNRLDGHALIARYLKFAYKKKVLRTGLDSIYPVQRGDVNQNNIRRRIVGHGLTNKFRIILTCQEKYFEILRELEENRGRYVGCLGLKRLSKKYKHTPWVIYGSFALEFVEKMGWKGLFDKKHTLRGAGKISRAIRSAA